MIVRVPSRRKRDDAVILIEFIDHLQRTEIIRLEIPI